LFHLLLLLAFVLPYAARTAWFVGMNGVQTQVQSFVGRLRPIAAELKKDGHRSSAALAEIVEEAAQLQPCLRRHCDEMPVWQVLLGVDRARADRMAWLNVVLAVSLLVYNLCRAVLTVRVAPLREEEERSGYSPAYRGWDGYRWLIGLHWVVQTLLWIALTSFLSHAWRWFTMPVWIRAD
jgi:hypothetical protein